MDINNEIITYIQAAGSGDKAAVEAFLDKHPDLIDAARFIPMNAKITALLHALTFRRTAVVELLLKRGASVARIEGTDDPPLVRAAKHQNIDSARLLLQHNAKVDEVDDRGETAFNHAVRHLDLGLAELLLQNDAQLDKPDFYKETARMRSDRLVTQEAMEWISLYQRQRKKLMHELIIKWEKIKQAEARIAAQRQREAEAIIENQQRLKDGKKPQIRFKP